MSYYSVSVLVSNKFLKANLDIEVDTMMKIENRIAINRYVLFQSTTQFTM